VVRTGHFEKFLKMIFGRLSLALEVTFGSCHTLLTGITGFLITDAIAGFYGDATGHHSCPFLPHLAPFLVLLVVALVGIAWPLLAATSVLPRMKAAPIASSPEACQVAVLSTSMVVFYCSRPSS
jgi:hypothetical protein